MATAALFEVAGERERGALLELASSRDFGDVDCGVGGLALLRDGRSVQAILTAIRHNRSGRWLPRLYYWAGVYAGGPDAELGERAEALVERLRRPGAPEAAGDDGIVFLGRVERQNARDLLVERFEAHRDGEIATFVWALAAQSDPRPRDRIVAIARELASRPAELRNKDERRRLEGALYYLLTTDAVPLETGVELLSSIAKGQQEIVLGFAAQTLCERAERRPLSRLEVRARLRALLSQAERLELNGFAPVPMFACGWAG